MKLRKWKGHTGSGGAREKLNSIRKGQMRLEGSYTRSDYVEKESDMARQKSDKITQGLDKFRIR